MFKLRYPLFVVLGLFVACGGKVLVDENGNPNPGGGAGTDVVLPGTTTGVGTSGSFGTAGSAVAGFYDTGGAYTAGFYGTGGVYVAGGAGFVTTGGAGYSGPCGPVLCPAGAVCCNPQCGICVPAGQGCPAIFCGSGGSGVAGSIGAGGAIGGCGTPDSCLARIPGPSRCSNEQFCLCKSCMCEANMCESDPGCQLIWQCALKVGCSGKSCYTPQTCQPIIDKIGLGSSSMSMFLKLDACDSGTGCASTCPSAVDAGVCASPPPAVQGAACNANSTPDGTECSWACADSRMNTYISKCSGTSCVCNYNGNTICSCKGTGQNRGSACGDCCPSALGWSR
jgi:hypothetical protein